MFEWLRNYGELVINSVKFYELVARSVVVRFIDALRKGDELTHTTQNRRNIDILCAV